MPQHWHPLNVFFLALQLLAVPSQAQGSCSCDPTTTMATGNASNTTTMGATMTTLAPVSNATTLPPVSNATTLAPVSDATTPAPTPASNASSSNATTMAPSSSDATTSAPAPAPSTTLASAPAPATTTTTTPSGGPSAGPARLLEEMWSGRVLQSSNATTTASAAAGSSNATTTTTTVMTAATTVAECPPCVVTPLVVSTFTSTLALTSASDLGAIDFDAMKGALVTDQGWDTAADVTVQVVVKVAVQYSFSAAITPLQCQTAVAIANGLDVDKVTCVGGAADNNTATTAAPATSTTTAAAAGRRLQAVMDVEITYDDQAAAVAAVETDPADMMDGLTAALQQDTSITTNITSTGAETGAVTVELEVTVTADEEIVAPAPESLQTAVENTATSAITVVATVSEVEVTFTRMPCDEGAGVCGSGYQLLANAATIGCAAELCTASDRDTCCTRMTVSDAREMCVLNSFLLLLLRNLL